MNDIFKDYPIKKTVSDDLNIEGVRGIEVKTVPFIALERLLIYPPDKNDLPDVEAGKTVKTNRFILVCPNGGKTGFKYHTDFNQWKESLRPCTILWNTPIEEQEDLYNALFVTGMEIDGAGKARDGSDCITIWETKSNPKLNTPHVIQLKDRMEFNHYPEINKGKWKIQTNNTLTLLMKMKPKEGL